MELSFDTTFLIDLHHDIANQKVGAATRFLSKDPDAALMLSVIAFGEFAAGFEDPGASWLLEVRRRFTILPVNEQVSFVYREVFRELKRKGRLIGANDLWIGMVMAPIGENHRTVSACSQSSFKSYFQPRNFPRSLQESKTRMNYRMEATRNRPGFLRDMGPTRFASSLSNSTRDRLASSQERFSTIFRAGVFGNG